MASSSEGRCGQVASDLAVILVTVAQLIFLTSFHKYIAWPITGTEGSLTRLSMLTEDYFTWLPIPITASIIVIVGLAATILYNRYWFRQAAWILFSLVGIAVTASLVFIFPFDFSVLPNATAVDVVPIAVRVFFVLMAVFYGASALILTVRLRKQIAKQELG